MICSPESQTVVYEQLKNAEQLASLNQKPQYEEIRLDTPTYSHLSSRSSEFSGCTVKNIFTGESFTLVNRDLLDSADIKDDTVDDKKMESMENVNPIECIDLTDPDPPTFFCTVDSLTHRIEHILFDGQKVSFLPGKTIKKKSIWESAKGFGVLFLYHSLADLFCLPIGKGDENKVQEYRLEIKHLLSYIDLLDEKTVKNFEQLYETFCYNRPQRSFTHCTNPFDEAIKFAFSNESSQQSLNSIIVGDDYFKEDSIDSVRSLRFTKCVEDAWNSRDSTMEFDENFLILKFVQVGSKRVKNLKIPLTLKLNVNGPKGPLWYRLVGVFYVEDDDNNQQQVNPSVVLATKSSTISEGSYFKAYIPNAKVYSFVPTSIADRVEEKKKIPFNFVQNSKFSYALGSCWVRCFDHNRINSESPYLFPMPVWNDGVPFDKKRLDRICDDYWLDDSIINVFLKKALFYFHVRRAVLMDSHFYNLFYDDSQQEENVVPNYDKVKTWTSKQYKDDKSLFDEDVVLHIPCNYPVGSHWIHTYINMKYKTINIIDPKHTEEYA